MSNFTTELIKNLSNNVPVEDIFRVEPEKAFNQLLETELDCFSGYEKYSKDGYNSGDSRNFAACAPCRQFALYWDICANFCCKVILSIIFLSPYQPRYCFAGGVQIPFCPLLFSSSESFPSPFSVDCSGGESGCLVSSGPHAESINAAPQISRIATNIRAKTFLIISFFLFHVGKGCRFSRGSPANLLLRN